jgi:hypothetical protein
MTSPLPAEWGHWVQEVSRLLAAPPLRRSEKSSRGPQDPKFALGDFLLGIPSQFVDLLADAVHAEVGQLRTARDVADKIPPERRVAASWTVHRDLRNHPELLVDGLTVRDAAAAAGKDPIDAKSERNQTVEERAKTVRNGLADPEVYALIDTEMANNRAERQLRHRARQVLSEHQKRGRELEAEVRALREAKSPFEATVKAELEINKAMQLVEAIAQTIDGLPQPERLLAALDELNAAVAGLLLEHRPSASLEDGPIVIEGETWQPRSARAALIAGSHQRDLPGEGRTVIDMVD